MELYQEKNIAVPHGFSLNVVDKTDSTNAHLLRLATEGAPHGQVLLARQQTAGKGSRGRIFFSPEGGIYLSLLLRDVATEALPKLTPMAAVAVLEALTPFAGAPLTIKWVNDVYLENKKVCGILCETAFTGEHRATVIGIGINLLPPKDGFPEGLRHPATSLLDAPDPLAAEQIISTLLHRLQQLYQGGAYMEKYKAHCCTLGKAVTLQQGDKTIRGTAVDLTPDGGLILRQADGRQRIFTSGEVTSQLEE